MERIQAFGHEIPLEFLKRYDTLSSYSTKPINMALQLQVGEYLEALLNGTLAVDRTYGEYGRTIPR